jgi:hypothetical protein
MAPLRLSDHRGPIGSDTSRSVDPIGARHGRFGSGWLSDHRGSIGSNASRSIDPIGARGSVALLGESEDTKRKHNGERNVLHFKLPPNTSDLAIRQMPDTTLARHKFRLRSGLYMAMLHSDASTRTETNLYDRLLE